MAPSEWGVSSPISINPINRQNETEEAHVGKGDKRSKRGKIYRGTFGRSRPRKNNKKKKAAKNSSNEK